MSIDEDPTLPADVKTGYREFFGMMVLVAVVAVVLAGLITHSIGDEKVHVYYKISVPRKCLQLDAIFPDVQFGKAVFAHNQSNQLLGKGRLEIQSESKNRCEYVALFTIKRSKDRYYKIGVGDGRRGRLVFTDENLVNLMQGRTLVVSASLK